MNHFCRRKRKSGNETEAQIQSKKARQSYEVNEVTETDSSFSQASEITPWKKRGCPRKKRKEAKN